MNCFLIPDELRLRTLLLPTADVGSFRQEIYRTVYSARAFEKKADTRAGLANGLASSSTSTGNYWVNQNNRDRNMDMYRQSNQNLSDMSQMLLRKNTLDYGTHRNGYVIFKNNSGVTRWDIKVPYNGKVYEFSFSK